MAEVMVTDLRGDMQRIAAAVDVIYAWDKAARDPAGPRPGLFVLVCGT